MLKKISALFLSASLVSVLLSAPASADLGDELLTNCGFEAMATSYQPENWLASLAYWENNPCVSVDTTHARTGSNCIKLDTGTSSRAYVWYLAQNTTNNPDLLVPGDRYMFTAWMKSETLSTAAVSLSADYTYTDYSSARSPYYGNTNGEWVQLVDTFVVPEGVSRVDLYIKLTASGSIVYIDDASLVKIAVQDRMDLKTDEVFYYSDKGGSGTATVELAPRYTDNPSGTVEFNLKDGSTVLSTSGSISVSGDLTFTYPLSLLSEVKKEYTVEAVMKDSLGAALETQTESVFKYDRPTALRADGIYIVDGKPFNPVIAMGTTADMYPYLKDWGFNTVFCPAHLVDTAQSYGLKAIVFLYANMKPAGHPDNIQGTINAINTYHDHPGLLAWSVQDEPFGNYSEPEEWLKDSYTAIRNIDSVHPIIIVEEPKETSFSKAAKYCDILSVDPYPRELYPVTTYISDTIEAAVECVDNEKPVYATLQAFEWGGYFPDETDFRNMAYQAFLSGAKGINYYTFTNSQGSLELYDTTLWPGILSFHSQEVSDLFDYFVRQKYQAVSSGDNEVFRYRSWQRDGTVYITVLNLSDNEETVFVPVTQITSNSDIEAVKGCESSDAVPISGGINLTIEGRGVALLKLGDNLVSTGDFERFYNSQSDTYAPPAGTGWATNNPGSWAGVIKTETDSGTGEVINRYAELSGLSGSCGVVANTLTGLQQGTTYEISFSLKSSARGGTIQIQNSENVNLKYETINSTGGTFTTKMYRILNNDTAGTMKITFRNDLDVTSCWDNLYVRALSSEETANNFINGDMELVSNGIPVNFTCTAGAVQASTEYVYEGNYSLKLATPNTSNAQYTLSLPTPGKYRLSFQLKGTFVSVHFGGSGFTDFSWGDGNWTNFPQDGVGPCRIYENTSDWEAVKDSPWHEQVFYFTVPEGGMTKTLQFRHMNTWANAPIYIDDIKVVPASETAMGIYNVHSRVITTERTGYETINSIADVNENCTYAAKAEYFGGETAEKVMLVVEQYSEGDTGTPVLLSSSGFPGTCEPNTLLQINEAFTMNSNTDYVKLYILTEKCSRTIQ